jgi:hypothetical protein
MCGDAGIGLFLLEGLVLVVKVRGCGAVFGVGSSLFRQSYWSCPSDLN